VLEQEDYLWRPGFRAGWHSHERRGGRCGKHRDGQSGEVIGYRDGGVEEQVSCLLRGPLRRPKKIVCGRPDALQKHYRMGFS
jgi:hypothetical protein